MRRFSPLPTQGDGTHGDGATPHGDTPQVETPHVETPTWRLALPDTDRALRRAIPGSRPRRAERAGRRILQIAGLAALAVVVVAIALPIARTVELHGRLVPERRVTIRAAEAGLLSEILVAAGDTVRPGQLVARLRSPELDELTRRASGHDPALLARRARLDVYAPPAARRLSDGSADAASWWHGGIVLTEDLDRRRGEHLAAGDVLLDLAAIGPTGRVAHVVHAWAPEREAQRARPGMPARLTFPAIPPERPRQATGVVRRVSRAPDARVSDPSAPGGSAEVGGTDLWRVEVNVDPASIAVVLGGTGTPSKLHEGFSVEAAIEERHETIVQTAQRLIEARPKERTAP